MSPEMPYLAAGLVSIIGGTKQEGHFPKNGLNAVVGTVVLVIVASATGATRFAPLVNAVGLLILLGAVYAASKAFQPKKVV